MTAAGGLTSLEQTEYLKAQVYFAHHTLNISINYRINNIQTDGSKVDEKHW